MILLGDQTELFYGRNNRIDYYLEEDDELEIVAMNLNVASITYSLILIRYVLFKNVYIHK